MTGLVKMLWQFSWSGKVSRKSRGAHKRTRTHPSLLLGALLGVTNSSSTCTGSGTLTAPQEMLIAQF